MNASRSFYIRIFTKQAGDRKEPRWKAQRDIGAARRATAPGVRQLAEYEALP
jgi:hypothetical protein